jgi:hypothetical protein
MIKILFLSILLIIYAEFEWRNVFKCKEKPLECALDMIKGNPVIEDGVFNIGLQQTYENYGKNLRFKSSQTGILESISAAESGQLLRAIRSANQFGIYMATKKNMHTGSIMSLNSRTNLLFELSYSMGFILPIKETQLCFTVYTVSGSKQVCTTEKFQVNPIRNSIEYIYAFYNESMICIDVVIGPNYDSDITPKALGKCFEFPSTDLSNWEEGQLTFGIRSKQWSGELLKTRLYTDGIVKDDEEFPVTPEFNCVQDIGGNQMRAYWGYSATKEVNVDVVNVNNIYPVAKRQMTPTKKIYLSYECKKKGRTRIWHIINENTVPIDVNIKSSMLPTPLSIMVPSQGNSRFVLFGSEEDHKKFVSLDVRGTVVDTKTYDERTCIKPLKRSISAVNPPSAFSSTNMIPDTFSIGNHSMVFFSDFSSEQSQIWMVGPKIAKVNKKKICPKTTLRNAVLKQNKRNFEPRTTTSIPDVIPCCDDPINECGQGQTQMIRIKATDGSHTFEKLVEPHKSYTTIPKLYKYDHPKSKSINWNIPYYAQLIDKLWITPIKLATGLGNKIYIMIVMDSWAKTTAQPVQTIDFDLVLTGNSVPAQIVLKDDPDDPRDHFNWNATSGTGSFHFEWDLKHTDGMVIGPIDGCLKMLLNCDKGVQDVSIIYGGSTKMIGSNQLVVNTTLLDTHINVNKNTVIDLCVECAGDQRDICGVIGGDGSSCGWMKNTSSCRIEKHGYIIHKGMCPKVVSKTDSVVNMVLSASGMPGHITPSAVAKCVSGDMALPIVETSTTPLADGWLLYHYSLSLPWSTLYSCFPNGEGTILLKGTEDSEVVYSIPCVLTSKKCGDVEATIIYGVKQIGFDASFDANCKNDSNKVEVVIRTCVDLAGITNPYGLAVKEYNTISGDEITYTSHTDCEMTGSVCCQNFKFETNNNPEPDHTKEGDYKIVFKLITMADEVILNDLNVLITMVKKCKGYTEIKSVGLIIELFADWQLTIPLQTVINCERIFVRVRPNMTECNITHLENPLWRLCWNEDGVPISSCLDAMYKSILVDFVSNPPEEFLNGFFKTYWYVSNATRDLECTDTMVLTFVPKLLTIMQAQGNMLLGVNITIVPNFVPLSASVPTMATNVETGVSEKLFNPVNKVVTTHIQFHPICPDGHFFDENHHDCMKTHHWTSWHFLKHSHWIFCFIVTVLFILAVIFVLFYCICPIRMRISRITKAREQ